MSLKQNEIWMEAAKENFEQAIEERSFDLASDIFKDMKDAGLDNNEAITLEKALLTARMKVNHLG